MSLSDEEKMTILEQRMKELDEQVESIAQKRVQLYSEWYAFWSVQQNEKMEAWK